MALRTAFCHFRPSNSSLVITIDCPLSVSVWMLASKLYVQRGFRPNELANRSISSHSPLRFPFSIRSIRSYQFSHDQTSHALMSHVRFQHVSHPAVMHSTAIV